MPVPIFLALAVLPRKPGAILESLTLDRVLSAVATVLVAVLLARYIARLLEGLSARNPGARYVLKWLEQATRLALSFGAILAVITILAPDSDTFLAAIGSAAIAIGLGAQDLIKDLVGGLVLLTDRPYQLGDRVQLGDTTGEVIHTGLRSTKLRTPDDTVVTVPNSAILGGLVVNQNYGVPECLVVTSIFLPPETDTSTALRVGREAALCCPYLRAQRSVTASIADRYSESPYLELRIKAYVFDHAYVIPMQTDLTVRVKRVL